MFHLGKKTWIFIICFAVVSIAVTTSAILYSRAKNNTKISNSSNINSSEKTKNVTPDGLEIKSLNDTYDLNDILITNQKYNYGKSIKKENNTTYYVWNGNYIKISGLKNKTIEDSINNKIKETSMNLVVKEATPKDEYGYKIDCICNSNFSNVLSITFYNSYYKYNDKSYITSLNFNLTTGEEIKFSDLFTNTASLKHIIVQSAYTNIAMENAYSENATKSESETKSTSTNQLTYGVDMSGIDYSNIEEKMFEIINDYYSGSEIMFYFTPKSIIFRIDEVTISIKMQDFYQDIAIYNRYASNTSIYDGTYNAEKNVVVFINRTNCYYSKLDISSENVYFDFRLKINDSNDKIMGDTKYLSVIQNYIKKVENKVSKMKQVNDNTATLYSVTSSVSINDSGNLDFYEDTLTMGMDKEYYKNTFKSYAIESAQSDSSEYEYTNSYHSKDDDMLSKLKTVYKTDDMIYNISTNTYDIKTEEYKDGKMYTKIITYNTTTDEKISENETSSKL